MTGMALLRFLKQADGLQDPKGSLSSSIQPLVIIQANGEVRMSMKHVSRKHGAYHVNSADIRG